MVQQREQPWTQPNHPETLSIPPCSQAPSCPLVELTHSDLLFSDFLSLPLESSSTRAGCHLLYLLIHPYIWLKNSKAEFQKPWLKEHLHVY